MNPKKEKENMKVEIIEVKSKLWLTWSLIHFITMYKQKYMELQNFYQLQSLDAVIIWAKLVGNHCQLSWT